MWKPTLTNYIEEKTKNLSMGDTVILTSIAIKKVYYITPFIYFVMLAYTEAVCTDN